MLIKVRRRGFCSNKEEGSHISEKKVKVTKAPAGEDQFEVVHDDEASVRVVTNNNHNAHFQSMQRCIGEEDPVAAWKKPRSKVVTL
ncbi:thioesterase [Sesbania bispinosa]|nr:thioesterase [Sesbania bispinosa]